MDIDFLSLNKRYIKNQCFCFCIFRRNLIKQVTHSGTNPTSSPGRFSLALDPTSKAREKHPEDKVGTNPRSLLTERLVAFAHSHNTGAVSAHPLLIRMAQQSDPKSGAFNCRGELKAPHQTQTPHNISYAYSSPQWTLLLVAQGPPQGRFQLTTEHTSRTPLSKIPALVPVKVS